MKTLSLSYDVVVCGGGLAGFCAAVAAARHGAKVALVQDRPVLGGNASSEVRVTVHGATGFHAYARETGILSEVLIEERARNHEEVNENGWTNSVFDQVLYDVAQRTPGLTLHLNTAVQDVLLGDDEISGLAEISQRPLPDTTNGWYRRPACAPRKRIAAVVARVANAETQLTLRGKTFIDCTGDGLVADLAGCGWRMGSESKAQTGELHAPVDASTNTMGNSIHIRARDIGRPAPFTPPEWAKKIPDADFFHKKGRHLYDLRGGYWWIEIGMPWHTIHDNETIRHELTAWALAIWDWIKNHDETTKHRATNYALEWIGQVPGKRESRRVDGVYQLTEHDIQANVVHPDEIAYGGWFVDLHTPGGLLAENSEPAAGEGYKQDSEYAANSYVGPYGIPLRSSIAADVDNLLLAGRCVSATHAALGTVRVMATTALVGQAVGTGAALALAKGFPVSRLPEPGVIGELQQRLLRDGCFLPNVQHADGADLAPAASVTASSLALSHGVSPEGAWAAGGLGGGPDASRGWSLAKAAAQWIAVAGGRLETVSVCLDNRSGQSQRVRARLVCVEHIWDYRRGLPAVAETELLVPSGDDRWIDWPVALEAVPAGYLRLDLVSAEADIAVAPSWRFGRAILPGQVAAKEMSAKKLRRMEVGVSMAFRVVPAQPVYGPEQAVSGVFRPHRSTNLWRSDPAQPLPQSLQLAWKTPQRVAQVELTFPGHLLREIHAYPPFFRDPQTPRDYAIEAWIDGTWREVHVEKGNFQRHRRHALREAVTTDRIRILVHATNGDPSAALYEIRVYA
ncbi:MAG: hypothetical protein K0R17_2914 [Rariglobus sp.]|jgi:hypothetical protein|nr:hypothetical protein [Rariglobus sp.]